MASSQKAASNHPRIRDGKGHGRKRKAAAVVMNASEKAARDRQACDYPNQRGHRSG